MLSFYRLPALVVACLLVCTLVVALFASHRHGQRAASRHAESPPLGPLEAMASGLLGLVLAFNFSIAQSRFDTRQEVLVHEADAIGTAFLRCSVLAETERAVCQEHFRHYVTLRLAAYDAYLGGPATFQELVLVLEKTEALQDDIWALVSDAARRFPDPPHALLLSGVNSVIDLDADRRAALRIQVPVVVTIAIALSCLAWAIVLGYSAGLKGVAPKTAWVVVALLIGIVFGVAVDFDRPRSGFITMSAAEKAMENLHRSVNRPNVEER